MLSPTNHQIAICSLDCNLEEILNKMLIQRSELPKLDSQLEKKYQETRAAINAARTVAKEAEIFKLARTRLIAKQHQLKNQIEDISERINNAQEEHNKLKNLLEEEEKENYQQIERYEDLLREKADWFRKTRKEESEVKRECEILCKSIMQLELEKKTQENIVKRLQKELDSIVPSVPDDILAIVGKNELEDKLKEVTDQCDKLRKI